MKYRCFAGVCLTIIVVATSVFGVDKRQAQIIRIADLPQQELRVSPRLALSDSCLISTTDTMVWQIDSWVTGNELYKAYIDPSRGCPNPYPFAVTEINMPMTFAGATDIYASVDIETVDLTDPSCPFPGEMLTLSSQYQLAVPQAGIYSIWIPLDSPLIVNGPFFAGFFIANSLDPMAYATVITDNVPALCTSYNIWDTTIGFVDLCNNELYSFPGRLLMQASGLPGGTEQPEPIVELITPHFSDTLLGTTEIWARETSGSEIIDYISFEYSNGSSFFEIGRDYDGTSPLRNGVAFTTPGDGFTQIWDLTFLAEGSYSIRATVYDTLGRTSSNTTNVYVEPTPPIPRITTPGNGEDFCTPLEILMSCTDENLPSVGLFYLQAATNYSAGLTAIGQSSLGDTNGNPLDGNLAANGEFGDYYCAPAAAAAAIKVWYDRGYTFLYSPPVTNLAEQLASQFSTRENLGTYDGDLMKGLYDYFLPRGAVLRFQHLRNPDYFTLRTWVEYEERSAIIGLGGNPGLWLAVDGFKGWEQPDGSYTVSVADPFSGTIIDVLMRNDAGTNRVFYNSLWRPVEIAVTIRSVSWNPTRTFIGSDNNNADGWSFGWNLDGISEGPAYFLRAEGFDLTNIKGTATNLARYDCSAFFTTGDYNNDGAANFLDLNLLIDFIARGGPAPVGGAKRADCNCDNFVNIADVVYYLNFIFGTVGLPCY